SNDVMLSSLNTALANMREMTVMAVVRSDFGSSTSDGRYISGMTNTGTNDTSGANAIIPLLRSGSSSGFANQYTGNSTPYKTSFSCGSACNSTAYIFTSIFGINPETNTITSELRGNGENVATKSGLAP